MKQNVVDVTVPIKPAKEVPVVVRTTGNLIGDRIVKKINLTPDRVTIVGEKKDIDKIKQIETVIYDISKISSDYTDELTLDIPPEVGIFGEINTVIVEFDVENIIENTVRIPINMINPKDGYNYSMSHMDAAVTIRGPLSIINAFDSSRISAIADVSGLEDGQHSLAIKLTAPDEVSIVSSSPEKITVTVSKPQETSAPATNR
jgi:YbbR domain-containing protein